MPIGITRTKKKSNFQDGYDALMKIKSMCPSRKLFFVVSLSNERRNLNLYYSEGEVTIVNNKFCTISIRNKHQSRNEFKVYYIRGSMSYCCENTLASVSIGYNLNLSLVYNIRDTQI